ncbi:MAG: phenylalanine--tRNA ligase subunit beta [Desulfurococcales archaeon ex4484_58]|nr:MAG: phenylalanine--tRNA ligase subunit beta [Desulfurococcales archaeon ex4484_58]
MPVIRVAKWDLERLVGRELSREETIDLLAKLKCEVEVISDDEIEYEATHDRPDLYSVEGLARGIRYLLGIGGNKFVYIDEGYKAYNMGVPRRPYVAFGIVKNVELDDEAVKQIMQLQEKLAFTYGRNRRKASIGVYDLDKFEMPIYYELRDPYKTRFIPLNEEREMNLREILQQTEKGREYRDLLKGWKKLPVIRDVTGKILSMPPIINSEDTKVTENTRNILIDSTGTDLETVVNMVTIMATSIAERSPDRALYFVETIMLNNKIVRAPRDHRGIVEADIDNISSLIGVEIKTKDLDKLFYRMGYEIVEFSNNKIFVKVPPYRLDVRSWVDLAEDIAIAYGYDKIGEEATSLPPATHPGRMHPLEFLSRTLRKIMISYGFVEVANYMMSNPYIQLEIFGLDSEMIRVSNPKMEKYTGLRIWLTPGLLEVYLENMDKEKEIKIFEIGDVAIPDPNAETGARIERRLGILISHDKATLTDGLAITNIILNTIDIKSHYEKTSIKGLLPQRTAGIYVDSDMIGFIGEIHPTILNKLNIEKPVIVVEIILNKILSHLRK